MFHVQRRYLVHKIWKARSICIGDQVSEKTFGNLKEAVHSFLAGLDLNSLSLLLKIVSGQEESGLCFNARTPQLISDERAVHRKRYLVARVWRWPDLKENHELKHIQGSCEHENMGDCLCVNPFHFSRIVNRDIPYRNLQATEKMEYEDSGLSCTNKEEDNDQTISVGANCTAKRRTPWVKLAYWERNVRVGTMYHGYESTINIYESLAKGHHEGFCLTELERTDEMNEPTKIVFRNIGDGVQISLEDGNIWIYNRSSSPVFINGELLQTLHHTKTPRVEKLLSGFGLKVFDSNNVSRNMNKRRNDPHSLRVSFVKGFGHGYKRQYITNCPCWVEMFFFLPEP